MADARRIVIEFIGKDKSLSSTADKVEGKTSAIGGKLKKFGAAAAAGFAVAGAAAVKFGSDAIGKASDLNETLNKSEVIFGKQAPAMEKWASGAAKSAGLSQNAALSAAASFGDMFSQIGFGGDQAAKMSKGVVQLSADLGSFNNLETADVADRMSAAFRGEYDSLQAIIPNINAARVEQEALAMTGKSVASELTAQEKAAATLAIVQKDGARASGDFARTSDGLANQQKILAAQFENVQAKIGQKLLPIATKLIVWLNGEGIKTISAFAGELRDTLAPIIKALAPLIKGAFKVIKGVFKTFSALLRGDWKGMWEGIKTILRGAAEVLKNILRLAFAALGRIGKLGADLLVRGIKAIPGKIKALGGLFKDAGKWLLDKMLEGLKNAAGFVSGLASNVWRAVKGLLNDAIDKINAAVEFTIDLPGPKNLHVNPPDIPHLAKGGLVTRPTLALIGEDGPEAVVPLGRKNAPKGSMPAMSGGGDVTVILQLDGQEIHRSLLKRKRTLGQGLGLA